MEWKNENSLKRQGFKDFLIGSKTVLNFEYKHKENG